MTLHRCLLVFLHFCFLPLNLRTDFTPPMDGSGLYQCFQLMAPATTRGLDGASSSPVTTARSPRALKSWSDISWRVLVFPLRIIQVCALNEENSPSSWMREHFCPEMKQPTTWDELSIVIELGDFVLIEQQRQHHQPTRSQTTMKSQNEIKIKGGVESTTRCSLRKRLKMGGTNCTLHSFKCK